MTCEEEEKEVMRATETPWSRLTWRVLTRRDEPMLLEVRSVAAVLDMWLRGIRRFRLSRTICVCF